MISTELADRIQINELVAEGQDDQTIAKTVGWSVHTVRKWRYRYRDHGRAGLKTKMGRPKKGAMSTCPVQMREVLVTWRKQHPGWGAKTLRTELEMDERFKDKPLPSLRSINRLLEQQQLLDPQEPHSALPQLQSDEVQAAHEEWEIDARGHEYIADVGVVELINLNDCYSRARLLNYPCVLGQQRLSRRANTEDYQLILRLAFSQWGLPQRLASDHHRLFYDGKSHSPFPTRLHLWLIALGISLEFGRFSCPTDQAITERSHQLWDKQVLQGQTFNDWDHLFNALQQRKDFLNYHLPCASLDEQPPLVAHPEALSNPRLYRPEWETDLLDLDRVYAYLAQGRWFRRVSKVGTFSLGGQVYYIKSDWAGQQVEISFDPDDLHFIICASDGQLIKRFFPKALSLGSLSGELSPLINLPAFQLALPFSWSEWRQIRLSDTFSLL